MGADFLPPASGVLVMKTRILEALTVFAFGALLMLAGYYAGKGDAKDQMAAFQDKTRTPCENAMRLYREWWLENHPPCEAKDAKVGQQNTISATWYASEEDRLRAESVELQRQLVDAVKALAEKKP